MSEILTLLKSEWKGVRNSDVWAFGTTPQLSEIQTGHPHHNTTFRCGTLALYNSIELQLQLELLHLAGLNQPVYGTFICLMVPVVVWVLLIQWYTLITWFTIYCYFNCTAVFQISTDQNSIWTSAHAYTGIPLYHGAERAHFTVWHRTFDRYFCFLC